jgi:hypothetical protein
MHNNIKHEKVSKQSQRLNYLRINSITNERSSSGCIILLVPACVAIVATTPVDGFFGTVDSPTIVAPEPPELTK